MGQGALDSCLPRRFVVIDLALQLPEVLLKDRSAFRGAPFDAARIKKMRPLVKLQIAAHLDLLEQQLAAGDGRSFFGTSTPSYVDVSAFFVLNWIERNGARKEVLNPETLPKTVEVSLRPRHLVRLADRDLDVTVV